MYRWQRSPAAILGAVCIAGIFSACSSSGGGSSSTGASTPATPTAQVRAAWTDFFAGSTPASKKVALLQDGSSFAQVIDAQASSPLAKGASVTVSSVHIASGTATVHYALDLNGKPALTNQTGKAVLVGSTWKVSDASFCSLLALQGQRPSACTG